MVEFTHGRDSRSSLTPAGSISKYTREENAKFSETTDQSHKSGRNLSFSQILLIWTRVVLPVPTSSSLSPKFRPSALHTAGSQTHAKPPFPDRWKYDLCISSRDPSPPQPAPPPAVQKPQQTGRESRETHKTVSAQPAATSYLMFACFNFYV